MSEMQDIKSLYADASKHAQYQPLPDFMGEERLLAQPKYRHFKLCQQRLDLLRQSGVLEGAGKLLDVGANIGYFSLSLAQKNPELTVASLEPNAYFCHLIDHVKSAYRLDNLRVLNDGYSTSLEFDQHYDIGLFFNVLHHGGAEFDQHLMGSVADWFGYFEKTLKQLSGSIEQLVVQMGFNWGGDKAQPIHPSDDPMGFSKKMILSAGQAGYVIDKLGIPYRRDESFAYQLFKISEQGLFDGEVEKAFAMSRSYTESEFFRRPILFLKRAKKNI